MSLLNIRKHSTLLSNLVKSSKSARGGKISSQVREKESDDSPRAPLWAAGKENNSEINGNLGQQFESSASVVNPSTPLYHVSSLHKASIRSFLD